MLRKHRLAEVLLVDVLKVPWPQVHDEACRLEHAISDNLERHLVALLGDPGTCPHGSPIPGSANVVETGPLVKLSAVPPGGSCTVRRIDEHLQTLVPRMEELEGLRLLPGQQVRVDGPDDGQVLLNVDGRSVRSTPPWRPRSTSACEGRRLSAEEYGQPVRDPLGDLGSDAFRRPGVDPAHPEGVVGAAHHLDLHAGRRLGHPEGVPLALHDEDRHAGGEQLRQPAVLGLPAGGARRSQREGQREHAERRGGGGGAGAPAGHPGSGAAAPDDQRPVQRIQDGRPRLVEPARRLRHPPAADQPGLLHPDHPQAELQRRLAGGQQVPGLHARSGAGAVTEHERRTAAGPSVVVRA
jgi:hypothetical protein